MKKRILVILVLSLLCVLIGGCKDNEKSNTFIENLKIDKPIDANVTI